MFEQFWFDRIRARGKGGKRRLIFRSDTIHAGAHDKGRPFRRLHVYLTKAAANFAAGEVKGESKLDPKTLGPTSNLGKLLGLLDNLLG